MEINVLSENTTSRQDLLCEHGLSMLIKTDKTILFDTGQSGNFLKNAQTLGVDIKSVDFLVLSHGHYDHTGGLEEFLRVNHTAKVYIKDDAFKPYYSLHSDGIKYIGIKEDVNSPQIVTLSGDYAICDNVSTMCNVKKLYPMPSTNKTLYKDSLGKVLDDFTHEQDLVIKQEDGYILFVGCAHTGIKNILEHFYSLYNTMPKVVVGGFHLASRTGAGETDEYLVELANYLLGTGAMFYTCHCTGEVAYKKLKAIMGSKVEYISTGSVVEL